MMNTPAPMRVTVMPESAPELGGVIFCLESVRAVAARDGWAQDQPGMAALGFAGVS